MALFLLVGLFLFETLAIGEADHRNKKEGVFGGPAPVASVEPRPFIASEPEVAPRLASAPLVEEASSFYGALQNEQGPFQTLIGQGGVVTYKVRRGDTLSQIARDYGISVQTLIASNPEVRGRPLQVDQALRVLPVSGALYEVKPEETPEAVAYLFHLTVEQLQEFNRSVDFTAFGEGTVVLIPGANPEVARRLSETGAPNVNGYFLMPAQGFNWGKLHERNAVDIANACGTEIKAAAEGLVIDASNDLWSFGYGRNLTIEHPNGTKTRYGHLQQLSVSIGDYVEQGEPIAEMGNTGASTGCHLHFEVEGAKNPFVR